MNYEIWQAPAEQVFRRFPATYRASDDWRCVWTGEVADILHPGDDEFEPDVRNIARARIFNAFQRVDEYVIVDGQSLLVIDESHGDRKCLVEGSKPIWVLAEDVVIDEARTHMPPQGYTGRSLSAGDLLRVDDAWWFVESLGWKEVKPPLMIYVGRVDRTGEPARFSNWSDVEDFYEDVLEAHDPHGVKTGDYYIDDLRQMALRA